MRTWKSMEIYVYMLYIQNWLINYSTMYLQILYICTFEVAHLQCALLQGFFIYMNVNLKKKIKYITLILHKHEYGFRQTNKNNIHKQLYKPKTHLAKQMEDVEFCAN